jgi:hypothetical protein
MANGGPHHTDEEWKRMDAELQLLEAGLERFALEHGAKLVIKAKDWPGRSIEWSGGVESRLQVFVFDPTALTMDFSIMVFQDRGGKRSWKHETLLEEVHAAKIADGLLDILEAGKRKIDHWTSHPEELEFAGDLRA